MFGKRGALGKGDVIDVDYAVHVEKKGFSVLIGTITRYRQLIPNILYKALKAATGRI